MPQPAVAGPEAKIILEDVDARDIEIHNRVNNIVIVGQVLGLAGVGDLLPSLDISGFKGELDAIETTLSTPFGLDTTAAVARTGDLIRNVFQDYQPKQPNEALPFRQILPRVAAPLQTKLESLNFWENYSETIAPQAWSFLPDNQVAEAEVIWLRHLKTLWTKHFKASAKLYGLAKINVLLRPGISYSWLDSDSMHVSFDNFVLSYAAFVVKQGKRICEAYDPGYPSRVPSRSSDFGQMSPQEFRLFMIGLVIELILLVSNASQDNTLWNKLKDLFPQPG